MKRHHRIPNAGAFQEQLKRRREDKKAAREAVADEQVRLYGAAVLEETKAMMDTIRALVLERRFYIKDELEPLKYKEAVLRRVPVRYSALAGGYVITSEVVGDLGPSEEDAYKKASEEQQRLVAEAFEEAMEERVELKLPVYNLHPDLKPILEEQGYWILNLSFKNTTIIRPKETRRVVYEPIEPAKQ